MAISGLMDQPRLIECIPNFSEGCDTEIIRQISDAIKSVAGVKVLHVDSGVSANRTVITFIGIPEAVVEAAFQAISRASELIDMRAQTSTHPRMGATDVCPFVPYRGISLAETVQYSRILGKRVGEELGIPVYLYEASASTPSRKNLASIRSGEYEGFRQKIYRPEWKPDFGPQEFCPRTGQTVIGARDFLIAYNLNLNTTSVDIASEIARDIRESGRVKRIYGRKVLDPCGSIVRESGACKGLKAIGWYMEEYGIAQVSTNVTDLEKTPLHLAFEAAVSAATEHGVMVTGSELVGMIPRKALLQAGLHFEKKLGKSNLTEEEQLKLAIRQLGLNDCKAFDPQQKIIENQLGAGE